MQRSVQLNSARWGVWGRLEIEGEALACFARSRCSLAADESAEKSPKISPTPTFLLRAISLLPTKDWNVVRYYSESYSSSD